MENFYARTWARKLCVHTSQSFLMNFHVFIILTVLNDYVANMGRFAQECQTYELYLFDILARSAQFK